MKIASSPGKVHLIGEHAVVYGEPAILAAVGLRTTIEAERSNKICYRDSRWGHDNSFSLDDVKSTTQNTLDLWNKCAEKGNFSDLFESIKENKYANYKKSMIGLAMKRLKIDGGISINIKSDIPSGAGIGSSASLAVTGVQAIAAEYGKQVSLEEINDIAFAMEQLIHGTPSGGDNSACCFGRVIWFQKSTPKNIIKPLANEVPYKLENFVLVYTKPPEKNTGELVQLVRNLDESFRTPRVQELGRMTHQMLEAIKKKDITAIQSLMNKTQKNLAELGVSIPEIDEIASAVREIGGAAKLCGAGGGGIMICHHENKEKLMDIISSLGYEPIETDLSAEGVK